MNRSETPPCPECGTLLDRPYSSCSCGWRKPGAGAPRPGMTRWDVNLNTATRGQNFPDHIVDKQCAFDDHGHRCSQYGCITSATNGEGPWYCSKHWWQIKRVDLEQGTEDHDGRILMIRQLIASKLGRRPIGRADAPAESLEGVAHLPDVPALRAQVAGEQDSAGDHLDDFEAEARFDAGRAADDAGPGESMVPPWDAEPWPSDDDARF